MLGNPLVNLFKIAAPGLCDSNRIDHFGWRTARVVFVRAGAGDVRELRSCRIASLSRTVSPCSICLSPMARILSKARVSWDCFVGMNIHQYGARFAIARNDDRFALFLDPVQKFSGVGISRS